MRKLFSLLAALTLSVGLWAEGSVFTYTATEKLTLKFMNLGTVATHEFKDGNGKVTYNETITTIGEYAFNGCSALQSITIPASVTTIGKGAFYKTGLTSITIPAGVTEIGENAFNQCKSLASVTLPEGVTTIGEYAFNGCSALQSVTLPEGLTTIGQYAFYGAGLTSITIPAGVTTIGGYAFYDCTALASVTFLGNACQGGIGNNAFGRVGDPTPALLTLPANWTGTKPNAQGIWYNGHFTLAAPAKTSVITYTAEEKLPETTDAGQTVGLHLNAFYAADSTQLIVTHTFDQGVGTITLNGEVAIIGDYAFYQTGLTSVTIPEGVTTIGMSAINNCYALQSITIPASVTTIGEAAFAYCFDLASVTFLGNACQDAIGEDAFTYVGNPDPALLTLPNSWTGTLPDEDGNWYGGKFEMSSAPTALPQMRAAVKATKVMTNGQVILRAENKNYTILGQEK